MPVQPRRTSNVQVVDGFQQRLSIVQCARRQTQSSPRIKAIQENTDEAHVRHQHSRPADTLAPPQLQLPYLQVEVPQHQNTESLHREQHLHKLSPPPVGARLRKKGPSSTLTATPLTGQQSALSLA